MLSLKPEYFALLRCPVSWEQLLDYPPLVRVLQLYWLETMERFEVANESLDYRKLSFDEIEEDDPELKANVINCRTWHTDAVLYYNTATRVFQNLKFAITQSPQKHFLHVRLTNDVIRDKSKNGTSYFYSEFDPNIIENFLWSCIAPRWRECINHDGVIYFYSKVSYPIGAAWGQDTGVICFHVDCGALLWHAYPILNSEIPPNTFVSDMVNFGDEQDSYQDECYGLTFVSIDDPV